MYKFSHLCLWATLSLALTGCQHFAKNLLGPDLSEKDFATLTTPAAPLTHRDSAAPLTAQSPIPAAFRRPISINFSEAVPLDIILERVANLMDINIQIDQSLKSAPITLRFSEVNKPFIDILENICSLTKLRYRLANGTLFLEKDKPFRRSYNVQFLNLTRSSENRISSATDIFANSVLGGDAGASALGAGENGSNTSVRMNSENNFWKEVEVNLQTLLQNDEAEEMSSKNTFAIHKQAGIISVFGTSEQHHCVKEYLDLLRQSVSSQILIEAKVIEVHLNENFKSGIDWNFLRNPPLSQAQGSTGTATPPATGGTTASATTTTAPAAGAATTGGGTTATPVAGAAVGAVATTLATAANATSAGDQDAHFYGGRNLMGHFGEGANTLASSIPKGFFQYTAEFGVLGLSGIIQALQHFGATKTLSSPRLTVMNNQSAILKVAKNQVYFKLNYNTHYSNKADREDISVGSDIQTVPVGLVMSVQPAIDPATKSVILFLRPTLSREVGHVVDPSIAVALKKADKTQAKDFPESRIPIIEVKEIDSVLRLKDNEVAILGGLMETSSRNNRYKHPVLGEIPFVKEAFSSANKDDSVTEVVILIRVKILEFVPPDSADARLVHLYTNDPRPLL